MSEEKKLIEQSVQSEYDKLVQELLSSNKDEGTGPTTYEEFKAQATTTVSGNYTKEQIEDMKWLGLEKPDSVSLGDWLGPKDHSHRHDLLAQLAATGMTNNDIAKELNLSASRVSIILSQSEMKQKIKQIQEKHWGANAQKRFEKILPKAIDVAEHILDDVQEKSQLRADVAFRLMDRALGKPKQEVAVQGSMISELIHRLDNESRDVTPTKTVDTNKDELDNIVDSLIPESITVGDKNG